MSDDIHQYRKILEDSELSTTAEAWLPLPEKIVPTVLGTVGSIKEMSGEILKGGNPTPITVWSESLNY